MAKFIKGQSFNGSAPRSKRPVGGRCRDLDLHSDLPSACSCILLRLYDRRTRLQLAQHRALNPFRPLSDHPAPLLLKPALEHSLLGFGSMIFAHALLPFLRLRDFRAVSPRRGRPRREIVSRRPQPSAEIGSTAVSAAGRRQVLSIPSNTGRSASRVSNFSPVAARRAATCAAIAAV